MNLILNNWKRRVIGSKVDRQLKELVRRWGWGKANRQSGSLFKTECNFIDSKLRCWTKNQSQALRSNHLKKFLPSQSSNNIRASRHEFTNKNEESEGEWDKSLETEEAMLMDGQDSEDEREAKRKPKTVQNSVQFSETKFVDFGNSENNDSHQDSSILG